MTNNGAIIRGLMQDISKKIEERERKSAYSILNDIIISMKTKYNLQDDEIIKQLELIFKSLNN